MFVEPSLGPGVPQMADDLLTGYRRNLMDRFLGQVEEFRRHPVLADGPRLHEPIKPGGWSAHRVLFHVRAAETEAYGPRMRRIVEHDRPELPDFDETAWMDEHYAPDESVGSILDRWQAVRRSGGDFLARLPVEAWNRTGHHFYWGERTLQWWVERSLAHAEEHRRQLDGE